MKKKVEGRFLINWIYAIAIILVIFSNVFANKLEILLKLRPNIIDSQSTQIHFIDVGQGDAIAINLSNGKTMLVDSGIADYRKKLIHYLDNIVLKDSRTIDYLILTHPDIDHSGNMDFLLKNYKVKNFFRPRIYEKIENKSPYCVNETYRDIITTLKNIDTNVIFNDEQNIIDQGITISWLNVLDMQDDLNSLATNQFSPVIVINDNGNKVMLTGDIDSDTENKLIEKYSKELLDVDILKLAHHGSKYSSSYEFLETTSPKFVVTCVGENSYGHPANDTILRLLQYDQEYNTELFNTFKNTKDHGNIIYTLDSNIHIDEIDNIDNYNFVEYWFYSVIMLAILLYFFLTPYYFVWKKNIRFIIQNKIYKIRKLKEKQE